jgi:SOS-response transcriptional repressor LexA
MAEPLTARQRAMLEAFVELQAEGGAPPTVRALAARMGIQSPNGVMSLVLPLARKGYLLPPDPEVSRQCWMLSPRALAEAGRVVARWPYVRMLATSADMSPAEARALARELLEKADAVDAEAGAGG